MDYIIASLPRSGSNFLCELLARNGLGIPSEDFSTWPAYTPFLHAIAQGESTEQYRTWLGQNRSVNNVLAIKIFSDQLSVMHDNMQCFTPNCAEMLKHLFPNAKYIYLTRRDKLYQAISLAKALKSNQFSKLPHEKLIDCQPTFEEIKAQLFRILSDEHKWRQIFYTLHCTASSQPLQLVYEEYIQDIPATIHQISLFLKKPIAKEAIVTDNKRFTKQGNETNQQLYQEFLQIAQQGQGNKEAYLANLKREILSE